ncbi:MAG TPA: ABC transporter ATP-binding protein [Planctomycetaceae bacterium]|jgi:lipoprotein-releasing system ATP-binding protein|nr:ABC transporter ATP-binding protein [Planctomycetaceae bacterium]
MTKTMAEIGSTHGPAVSFTTQRTSSASIATQSRWLPAEGGHASGPHISAVAVEKAYRKGQHKVAVLRGVNINVRRGEFLSIIGQSGSGKSTLLHLLGLLDCPDIGEVLLEGQRMDDLPVRTRDQLRNRVFGFIFQFYHLLPELSLLENVLAPLMIRYSAWEFWKRRREFRDRASEILHLVGLDHRLKHRPSEMSGGEMQRAAIARALVARPEILLADEPTGNLDARTGQEITELLASLNEREQLTILMVTHDDAIAQQAHRIVRLSEGQIEAVAAAA